jgi:5-methylcytosine-specific restriction endonuclease McrA
LAAAMSDRFYQSQEWRRVRYRALQRDRWRCTCCGRAVRAKGDSRVDHVVARRERPDLALTLSNLRTLCTGCDAKRHSEKGGRHVERPVIALDGLPAAWR